MSIIKEVENNLIEVFKDCGYEIERLQFSVSNRVNLGEYQINNCMNLAKIYHKSPLVIAEEIKSKLEKDSNYTNINIAGAGFINISFSDKFLIESLNRIIEDINNNIDKEDYKKIILDYGGANIAKTLHVGHLRSANIGEALKRLSKTLGYEVISDVHFGDIGRQSGMVISEIKKRHPQLDYFNDNYHGDYEKIDFTITEEQLGEIYPIASLAAKNDEIRMEEVREITAKLEEGHKGYTALWNKIKKVSIEDITKIYKQINTSFDLLEGESDCYPYMEKMLKYLKENNYLESSQNALVIDIKKDTDTSPMPPLIVVKSNNSTLYATRELATIYSRVTRFHPDEIWYLTDSRQSLYFEQVFRAAKKTKLAPPNLGLYYYGFGTMNNKDKTPFKTRDGEVMSLKELIELVKNEVRKKINISVVKENNVEKTTEIIAISTLKYADFLPFRTTDYIFDISKFSDLEGKTAPYLLYSTVRMKSLLKKAQNENITYKELLDCSNLQVRKIALTLLEFPNILKHSLQIKSLNEIAEYIYKLTSTYNNFYAYNKILTEENTQKKASYLAITKLVYDTNLMIFNILGMEVPEKM